MLFKMNGQENENFHTFILEAQNNPHTFQNLTQLYKYSPQFQCSTSLPPNPSSPKIEREGSATALLSAGGPSNHAPGCNSSTEKLLEVSSQNSLVLQRSSTATSTSLVLNNEDESLIDNDPDVILQQHQGNLLLIVYYI